MAPPTQPLTVYCLCAAWCGVCREYRAVFDAVAQRMPETQFAWVDVEDEAAVVDPVEVENFPTVLMARGDAAVFFGTVTPHAATLQRLVEAASALPGDSGRLPDAATALARRLAGR
jgi:thioredoxin 1